VEDNQGSSRVGFQARWHSATAEWIDVLSISAERPGATHSTLDTPRRRYRCKVLELDQQLVLSWLWKFTRDFRPLDDLVQEVYERLLRVDDTTAATIRSVTRYAFGVSRHVARDWCRRQRSLLIEYVACPEKLTTADRQKDVEEIVAGQQEIALLLREIRTLPARCRKILVLVKVFGHSAKEVATHMGIAESTVKKQLQIAAARCAHAGEVQDPRPGSVLLSRLMARKRVHT
jgi:RNA polymerase sigma factor (sigma-70 family)